MQGRASKALQGSVNSQFIFILSTLGDEFPQNGSKTASGITLEGPSVGGVVSRQVRHLAQGQLNHSFYGSREMKGNKLMRDARIEESAYSREDRGKHPRERESEIEGVCVLCVRQRGEERERERV